MTATTLTLRPGAIALFLALAVGVSTATAAYPGDNGRIVFVSITQGRGGLGSQDILSMHPDGTGMRSLSHGDPDVFVDFDPVWSPDGKRISFVRSFGSVDNSVGPGARGSEIYVMNADGKRKRRLTRNLLADGNPTWSPDGKRILFWRGRLYVRKPFADLWVMNADGTKQRRLLKTSVLELDPAWAPRGGRIAFVTSRATSHRTESGFWSPEPPRALWTASPNGRARRSVVAGPETVRDPNWSPDGARLVFSTRAGVMVVNTDGRNARLLARGLGDAAWAPNGSALVAVGSHNPFVQFQAISVVSLDGTSTPITRDPVPPGAEMLVEHSQPNWQPRPRR